MTASYQPTVVPNKDLGIWNEPVKIVINLVDPMYDKRSNLNSIQIQN